jgi:hypothetical protein
MYWFTITLMCVLIFILTLKLFYKKQREGLENNYKILTLDEFNDLFKSEIITLPKTMYAAGVIDNTWYLTVDEPEVHNQFKLWEYHYIKNNIHPLLKQSKYYYIMYFWDGYREKTQMYNGELVPYVPYKGQYNDEYDIKFKNEYILIHKNKYIFAYCKQLNDHNTLLLPDYFYISSKGGAYKDLLKEIDDGYVQYNDKINKCIYRGSLNNGSVTNFMDTSDKDNMNQREYFKKLYNDKQFKNMEWEDNKLSLAEQIKYKYILDIDGWASTYNATVWKLYSGSVLLKVKSIWKQWYYDELKEYVHYVPVKNDFSNLNEQIQWCIDNNDKCEQITKNAKQFVINKLNAEQVIKDTAYTFKEYLNKSEFL